VPLALKIAPDMDGDQVKNIADALIRHKIDGVIATNTTLNRDAVTGMLHGAEAGGLSGAPVFQFSNTVIRLLKAELGDALPIIGVGGIMQVGCQSENGLRRAAGAAVQRPDLRRPGPHQGLRGRLRQRSAHAEKYNWATAT
jgi:dihydroorotate dehydrogenase